MYCVKVNFQLGCTKLERSAVYTTVQPLKRHIAIHPVAPVKISSSLWSL